MVRNWMRVILVTGCMLAACAPTSQPDVAVSDPPAPTVAVSDALAPTVAAGGQGEDMLLPAEPPPYGACLE
jgi:hypothetical protein